jgi:hypothetical protein
MPIHNRKVAEQEAAAQDAAPGHKLALVRVDQQQPNWCWAAVGLELLRYYQRPLPNDLCGVVRQSIGCPLPCTDGSCNRVANIECILHNLGFTYQSIAVNEATVRTAISAGHPIVTQYVEGGAYNHYLVIHGYDTAPGASLYVTDSSQDFALYTWALDQFAAPPSFEITGWSGPLGTPGACRNVHPAAVAVAHGVGPVLVAAAAGAEPTDAGDVLASVMPSLVASMSAESVASGAAPAPHVTARFEPNVGLPIWSCSADALLRTDLSGEFFMGWRHFLSADQPLAIDLVRAGSHAKFKRAASGEAVGESAEVLKRLAAAGVDLAGASLLEVPCLAVQALRYKDAKGDEKIATLFSAWDDLKGDAWNVADFAAKVKAEAVARGIGNYT